jgi:transposase
LKIWRTFLSELNERQQWRWSESFLDGSFVPAKKGAAQSENQAGQGTKWMVVVDDRGLPLGNYLHSASPAEVKLAEATLATIRVGRRHHAGRPRQKPVRVIADKAYESDPLRKRLRQRSIELIVPHCSNRKKPATQDGPALRRYRRRWIVERTIGWLGNFRRLVVRYDRIPSTGRSFISHASCSSYGGLCNSF